MNKVLEIFHIFVVIKKKSVVYKVRKYITIREYTKRKIMNKIEFIIERMEQVWIACSNYLKNMKKRIVVGKKLTYVVPYMVIVR